MLTYKNILYSVTKILSDNFNCDVIVKNQEGTFENECFYVTLVPVTSKASTLRPVASLTVFAVEDVAQRLCSDRMPLYAIQN